jgi:hypothetical protein
MKRFGLKIIIQFSNKQKQTKRNKQSQSPQVDYPIPIDIERSLIALVEFLQLSLILINYVTILIQ